jgi:hypothetical protein
MSTTSGLRGPRDGQLTHIFDAFQYLTGEPGDHLASGLSIILRALQVIEVRSIAGEGCFSRSSCLLLSRYSIEMTEIFGGGRNRTLPPTYT